jgi:uncharacterized membrane protein SirB2
MGIAARYERWLRETDQWFTYEMYLTIIYPALGSLANQEKTKVHHITRTLMIRAIQTAISKNIAQATAIGAWEDFFDFIIHDDR